MTQTQRTTLDRAIERASAHHLHIAGVGTRNSDGATVYAVSSGSVEGLYHLVAVEGGRLVCSCKAGQRGLICQHRGLVYRTLCEQAEARRKADAERVAFADADRWALIEAGQW